LEYLSICADFVGKKGQLDREGNARKVVNCSCVVVRDWGEESQERSILLNYFQTEQ
jgi:small subunit ribosomal protein S12e